MSTDTQMPPTAALVQIASAPLLSRALWVVADRRVADHLVEGPAPAAVVASQVGLDPDALLRLMRALASVGIFAETDAPGTFVNTSISDVMVSGHPLAGRDAVLAMSGPYAWTTLGEFMHAATTGQTAVQAAFGTDQWSYFDAHPDESARFNSLMRVMNAAEPAAVAAAYDFSAVNLIVDLGGGVGTLLGTILAANPHLRGLLVDRASVLEEAADELERLGVSDRCERRAADFREAVPAGGDAYVLSHIVHDWDAASIQRLLSNCASQLDEDGRVLIVEIVLPEGNVPHPGKVIDIAMLAMPGGRERTQAEYSEILTSAGLALERVIPTQSGSSIIEARKV